MKNKKDEKKELILKVRVLSKKNTKVIESKKLPLGFPRERYLRFSRVIINYSYVN